MKNKSIPLALCITAMLIFSTFNIEAQNNNSAKSTTDTLDSKKLGEVVIKSFRMDHIVRDMPASLNVTPSLQISRASALSIANVLNYEPGIYMGSDGVWATSVNVRGLGEQRLVTLVDGDRIETATDLTASMSMFDVNDIERVEIIKGAQSVLYGTGAMGGIVNVITKDGFFRDKPYFSGNVTSSYASANNYFNEHAAINAGAKRWYFRASGTFGKAGNIYTPEGYIQNSQFTTSNASAKFGFKVTNHQLFKFQFQRNWSSNVGIPGGSAFPGSATATYRNIGRTLFDASYEFTDLTEHFKSLKINYYHQNIRRDVIMLPNSFTDVTLSNGMTQRAIADSIMPNALHVTNGAQIQGTFKFGSNNTLIAGVDFWRRDMSSNRTKYITMEILKPDGTIAQTHYLQRFETPLPTSSFTSVGGFIQDETHFLNNRLILTAGLRADEIFVANEACYDVDSLIRDGNIVTNLAQRTTFAANKVSNFAWSANVGLLFKINNKMDLVLNIARSFRSPSLEERFKYIDLGNYVRLGDPNLKPEHGYSADLGYRIWGDKFTLQASIYANRLTDMIAETQGQFVYSLTGTEGDLDTVPALIYANISKALLYGFDVKADYEVVKNLTLSLSCSYVRGRNTESKTDLPLIPPFNGVFSISYTYPKVGTATLYARGAAKQNKIAEGETATNGYYRLDFSLNTRRFNLGKRCGIQLFTGVDNFTNNTYTNHLATNRGSISVEPGINAYGRVNFTF